MTTEHKNIAEEEWFQGNPIGLMALDSEGRVCAVNATLEQILGVPRKQLQDHTRDSVPNSGLQPLFDDTQQLRLASESQERWLHRSVQKLGGANGKRLTLHLFQDVTELHQLQDENEKLRKRVEELAITDDLTGLTNQHAMSQMLTAQVTRSRRYQNPLSVAMVEIVPAEGGDPSDTLVLAISRYLRDRLRWADVIGRWDESRFMLMLPETPEDAAHLLIDKISKDVAEIAPQESGSGQPGRFQLRFGATEWHKGADTYKLIEQVKQAVAGEEAIVVSCGV